MSGIVGTSNTRSKLIGQGLDTVYAWVHWNGGGGSPEESYNVSSISNPETGQWLVNFTKASSTANYVAVVTSGGHGYTGDTFLGDYATNQVRVLSTNGTQYSNTDELNLVIISP